MAFQAIFVTFLQSLLHILLCPFYNIFSFIYNSFPVSSIPFHLLFLSLCQYFHFISQCFPLVIGCIFLSYHSVYESSDSEISVAGKSDIPFSMIDDCICVISCCSDQHVRIMHTAIVLWQQDEPREAFHLAPCNLFLFLTFSF